ncbi:uncharacterized protein [Labrus bergylta]|uniref:uncharacterized protein n=1 Tax=Labrus bergylta TaxID=56723 RepID=UPI003313B274
MPRGKTFRHGTGHRHRVQKWQISALTGHAHKLVIPAECPDKKLILVVGDSHLRALADGFVKMPEGRFSFGFMATPGGSAKDERIKLVNAVLPRTPAAVCLLAPSNNLTSSRTIEEAGVEFRQLIRSACERWSNELETVPQSSQVQAPPRPWAPRFTPRVVVKGEDVSPGPPANPFNWTSHAASGMVEVCVMPAQPTTACRQVAAVEEVSPGSLQQVDDGVIHPDVRLVGELQRIQI